MARRTLRSRPKLLLAEPDTRRRYLNAIREGVPLTHAATHAGINNSTVCRALRRAEAAEAKVEAGEPLTRDDVLCQNFARDVQSARAGVAVRNVALVQEAAAGGRLIRRRTLANGSVEEEFARIDWRAAKYLLDTLFKGEFTAASRMESREPEGRPVQVPASPSLRAMAESIRERLQTLHADEA